jgi:hypothetical protein
LLIAFGFYKLKKNLPKEAYRKEPLKSAFCIGRQQKSSPDKSEELSIFLVQ